MRNVAQFIYPNRWNLKKENVLPLRPSWIIGSGTLQRWCGECKLLAGTVHYNRCIEEYQDFLRSLYNPLPGLPTLPPPILSEHIPPPGARVAPPVDSVLATLGADLRWARISPLLEKSPKLWTSLLWARNGQRAKRAKGQEPIQCRMKSVLPAKKAPALDHSFLLETPS